MSRGVTESERAKDRPIGAGPIVRRWADYLVAILTGNIIFLFIEPQLPSVLRHRIFRIDLGLVVDFLICVVVYGLVWAIRGPENRDDLAR